MLGNGDELKHDAIPTAAPSKPPRSGSFRKHHTVIKEESGNHETPPNDQQQSEKSEQPNEVSKTTAPEEEVATSVALEVEKKEQSLDRRGGANEGVVPVTKLSDSLDPVPTGKSQGVENSLPVVHESEAATKAIPNGHPPSSAAVDETKGQDHSDDHARSGEVQAEPQGKEEAHDQEHRGDHNYNAAQMRDEKPEVQSHTEVQVHNDVRDHREESHTQDVVAPSQSEMKSAIKEEPESATKPITTTATAIAATNISTTVMMENSTEKPTTNQINESHSNSTAPKESESESKPSASIVEEHQQPIRKSSFGTSKNFRAEDSLFETALLLGKLASCSSAFLSSSILPSL